VRVRTAAPELVTWYCGPSLEVMDRMKRIVEPTSSDCAKRPQGSLAGALARVVGYQVVDRTGLTGTFDIDLRWTPEEDRGFGSDIFAAIQEQRGLELEPGRASVEMLVIGHAKRVPIAD